MDEKARDPRVSRDRAALDLLRLLRPDLRKLFPLDTAENVWAWLGWMATSGVSEYAQLRNNHQLLALLRKPSPQSGLSAVEWAIYRARPDVQQVIGPNETARIRHWFRQHAVAEHDLGYLSIDAAPVRGADRARPPGVNVVGYSRGELGIGEDCRMASLALQACGIPHCVVDFSPGADVSTGASNAEFPMVAEPRYGTNLFCLTALETGRYFLEKGAGAFDGFYNIGYWPWELRDWPHSWKPLLQLVDEVWVSSRHTYDAISPVSDKPVLIMPMAVVLPPLPEKDRADFALPQEKTLFCFSFDFNSSTQRKNPEGVLAAFQQAFPAGNEDVGLVIKSHHAGGHLDALKNLEAQIADDSRIHLINKTLSKPDVLALYAACDCFVSLHRAEGFGRGIAEAMLLGRHVITTRYSGNLEFCNDRNCDLVDAVPITLSDIDYPFGDGNGWSDPDTSQAAAYMRAFHDTREKKTMHANPFDVEEVGKRYRRRLKWLASRMTNDTPPPSRTPQ